MTHDNNPMAELSQLLAIAPEDRGEDASPLALHYEAKFGEGELVLPDGSVMYVTLDRAFLQLEMSGLAIQPGSEYGNICKPNTISTEHTSETVNARCRGKVRKRRRIRLRKCALPLAAANAGKLSSRAMSS